MYKVMKLGIPMFSKSWCSPSSSRFLWKLLIKGKWVEVCWNDILLWEVQEHPLLATVRKHFKAYFYYPVSVDTTLKIALNQKTLMAYDDFRGREPSPLQNGRCPNFPTLKVALAMEWLPDWWGVPWESTGDDSTKGEAPEAFAPMRLPRWFQKVVVFPKIMSIIWGRFPQLYVFFHPLWIETTTKAASVKLMWPWVWLPGPQVLSKVIWSSFWEGSSIRISTVSLFKIVEASQSKAFSNSGEHIYFHVFQRQKESVLVAISIQNPWNESSTILWLLGNLVQISKAHVLCNSQRAPVKDRNPWANFSPEWNET